MRAALYVRVSTEEQKLRGISVDNQISSLKEYCHDNGYTIVGVYNDAGISARKSYTKRPALLRLLEDCKSGKVDAIFFTKIDRWFRSVADYYEVQSILDKNNVSWRAISEDYETETSSGIFKVNIMLSVSQAEADRTSDRNKATSRYKKEKGDWIGAAPFGFKLSNSKLIIDEDVRSSVRSAFDAYISTSSIPAMHDVLLDSGIRITRRTCSRMLSNPIYAGHSNNHSCEAYLTQEEFDIIQSRRRSGKTRTPKSKSNIYLFQGMIRCPLCGAMFISKLRTRYQKSGKVVSHYYVCGRHSERVCPNSQAFSEKRLEQYCLDNIERVMEEYSSRVLDVSCSDHAAVKNERAKLEKQIRRIGDRYEMDEITREEYMDKVRALRIKLDGLILEEPRELKKLPVGWRDLYDSLSPSGRKSFWSQAIRYITIDGSGNVSLFF